MHRCAAVALTDVSLLLIPTVELCRAIADAPSVLAAPQGIRAVLRGLPWCAGLSRVELDALAFDTWS